MKHLATLVLVMLTLVSCKNSEKNLVANSLKVKTEKGKFTLKYEEQGLSLDSLILLKSYSDSFSELAKSLSELVKKKRGKKGFLKFLKNEKDIDSICGQHILSQTVTSKLFKECNDGHFNICPLSFSKFPEKKKELLKAIRSIGDNEILAKTDCNLSELENTNEDN